MSKVDRQVHETLKKKYGNYPEKVLQFGEGNFLRAFADWMIDKANEAGIYEGSIVICQPIAHGLSDIINAQDGVYTVAMRGIENGNPVEKFEKITSISRCINPYNNYNDLLDIAKSPDLEVIISNTTEAGIVYHEGDQLNDCPPSSYPAKLCALLYHRYRAFEGANDKGLLILPVELIDNNGTVLKEIVLRYADEWNLGESFKKWIVENNEFTNTLVDRIVTGYPRDSITEFEEKLGYKDNVLVTCELFNLWVIQGDKKWANVFPIHKTEANVIWTDNVTPYKKRKVRILNGSHTAVVPCAYLAGYNTVLDFFTNSPFGDFETELITNEILPVIDLPQNELKQFADDVMQRFCNPYIKHFLLDITLNNCSKFNARCIPTIKEYYQKNKEIPKMFAFTLAGFIRFYDIQKDQEDYIGHRDNGDRYKIKDDKNVLEFFSKAWTSRDTKAIVYSTLSNTDFWNGSSLANLGNLKELVTEYLDCIIKNGVQKAMSKYF